MYQYMASYVMEPHLNISFLMRPFNLPDIERPSTRPFIDALRPICEVTFNLLLNGYVSSLEIHHNCSVNQSTTEGGPRKSVDKWAEALSAAVRESHEFREADVKRAGWPH